MSGTDQRENLSDTDNFKLERYKYILQEIHLLNENIHKYLTLFQTLATAVVGGGVIIFVSWQKLDITAEIAKAGIRGLLALLILLALFVIVLILAGIFSWLDYRHEEVDLLNKAIGIGFRKPPSKKNLWRWSETYIIL